MSTSTASSSVSSFYTSNGVTRLNGSEFASGLDTQKLIAALTANTTAQINRQKQLEQKTSWKRDMFHEIEDLIQKFSDTYLSYSTNSSTNIMSKAFFDSEDLISSNSSIVTATGAASDAGNVVIQSISQLAAAATYTGHAVSKTSIDSTQSIGNTISSSSHLNLTVGGQSYTLALGKSIDVPAPHADGTWTSDDAQNVASQITQQLNAQATTLNKSIKDATGEDPKISFQVGSDGTIAVIGATVTGASTNFQKGLGQSPDNGATYSLSTMKVTNGSIANLVDLKDQLDNTTLTVQLDGLTKSITFDSNFMTKKDSDNKFVYSDDVNGVQKYLQEQMDSAFGSGKVAVSTTAGKLSMTTSDTTSIMKIASSTDSGVLGTDGLLHIYVGETNRTELDKKLGELSSELNTPLAAGSDGKYHISVNGKSFTFNSDTELNTVVNTINNDTTANVTVSYSQTLNQFRIVCDDTGTQGTVNVSDDTDGGNLKDALFGNKTILKSGDLSAAPTDNTTANYSFTLNGVTVSPLPITRSAGQTVSAFASSVQDAINGNSSLNGKITVGVSPDNKSLTFTTTDSESTMKICTADNSKDILGLGVANASAASATAGKDLSMTATLGGVPNQTITRSTNSFTLDSVTLHITGQTKEGDSSITFSSSNSVDDLFKKISTFVDDYNKIIDKINTDVTTLPAGAVQDNATSDSSKTYEPLTDDQKKTMTDTEITEWNTKAKQGLLFCDPQVSALQTDIRKAMENGVDSTGTSLANIGIATKPYDSTSGGKLIIDNDALKNALKSDPDKVAQLFTNSDGIATRIKDVITKNIGAFGNSGTLVDVAGSSTLVGADNSELGNEIKNYDERISSLNDQLKTEQDRLQTKFTEMETIISKLSDQYNYISNMSS